MENLPAAKNRMLFKVGLLLGIIFGCLITALYFIYIYPDSEEEKSSVSKYFFAREQQKKVDKDPLPRGAQVRQRTGCSMKPTSSSKTMLAFWRRPLFYAWPIALPEPLHGLRILLAIAALGHLATPAQIA